MVTNAVSSFTWCKEMIWLAGKALTPWLQLALRRFIKLVLKVVLEWVLRLFMKLVLKQVLNWL